MDVSPLEAIGNTFPPGSMTGAPKVKSCELISRYERLERGPYAGSLGYFAPGGDYDFNVVIRSVYYDEGKESLRFNVGGAVTWDSVPAAEYQESMLKAKGIFDLFDSF
jgi:para-aminobenzoate synthetase component 1